MTTEPAKHRRYRAWFTPNPPADPFSFETDTLTEAIVVEEAIADFSLELGERLIPVSVGGVEKWDTDGEAEDWYSLDGDEGADEPGIVWEGFDPTPRLREQPNEALRGLGQAAVVMYRQYLRERGITGMGWRA